MGVFWATECAAATFAWWSGIGSSLYALQFEPNRVLSYYVALALWALGLYIWWRIDRSMDRYALDAASQDEDAAASVGIDVTREKLKITAISAAMCALGGAIYAQYQMYIGPDMELDARSLCGRNDPHQCSAPEISQQHSQHTAHHG